MFGGGGGCVLVVDDDDVIVGSVGGVWRDDVGDDSVVGEGDERDGGEGGGRLAEDRPKVGRKVSGGEEEDMWRLGISFVTEKEEEDSSKTLPCQLPPKEMNPGSFTLPCTIGNHKLYDMADLGAGVNVMPKSLVKHLKLADLKETNMEVEMADMTKKAPLGILENILVKINNFLFHFDFVVIDMLEGLNETMLLGRPFLATIHAQIDVFRKEISLGIGEEKVKFDMNGGICHSRVPVEKIYMASSRGTPSCSEESIDTVDSIHDMQELEGSQDDEVGSHLLGNEVSRWHRKVGCSNNGYVFKIMKDKMLGGNGMIFADFLKVRTWDDPYSRRFDVYKEEFDNEIEQLENEYELKAGRKRYALDEVWEKCEKFYDTTKLWYDKGFDEEELGQNGIEEIDYTPPLVKSETFEVHRYTFKNRKSFIGITKQMDDVLTFGRVNRSRFMEKTRKEMDEGMRTTREM
ncbi:RNA-directed DNA polymerase, eukaryota, reverse transcriptase zinc-binding domain protein [Tanacetum coccineum]